MDESQDRGTAPLSNGKPDQSPMRHAARGNPGAAAQFDQSPPARPPRAESVPRVSEPQPAPPAPMQTEHCNRDLEDIGVCIHEFEARLTTSPGYDGHRFDISYRLCIGQAGAL